MAGGSAEGGGGGGISTSNTWLEKTQNESLRKEPTFSVPFFCVHGCLGQSHENRKKLKGHSKLPEKQLKWFESGLFENTACPLCWTPKLLLAFAGQKLKSEVLVWNFKGLLSQVVPWVTQQFCLEVGMGGSGSECHAGTLTHRIQPG